MKLYLDKLPDSVKQVKNALTWVSETGEFYGQETRILPDRYHPGKAMPHLHYGEYFQYQTYRSASGYIYTPVKYIISGGEYEVRHKRAHRIIAETFLPNPDNLPVVGHKNNQKDDNRVENLYWTTHSENTQKAVDDGLLVNKKGVEDSQSFPVIMIDTLTNQVVGKYGSVSEAERETGYLKASILYQCKNKPPIRKEKYFRFQDDQEPFSKYPIIIQRDFETEAEIARFVNSAQAAKATGLSHQTVESQCALNHKPRWTKTGFYFQRTII